MSSVVTDLAPNLIASAKVQGFEETSIFSLSKSSVLSEIKKVDTSSEYNPDKNKLIVFLNAVSNTSYP